MFHDSFYLKQLLKKLSEEVGLLLIYVYFFFKYHPIKMMMVLNWYNAIQDHLWLDILYVTVTATSAVLIVAVHITTTVSLHQMFLNTEDKRWPYLTFCVTEWSLAWGSQLFRLSHPNCCAQDKHSLCVSRCIMLLNHYTMLDRVCFIMA